MGLSKCLRSMVSNLLMRGLYRSMELLGLTVQVNHDFRGTFYARGPASRALVRT